MARGESADSRRIGLSQLLRPLLQVIRRAMSPGQIETDRLKYAQLAQALAAALYESFQRLPPFNASFFCEV
jgi:hypothetical protein